MVLLPQTASLQLIKSAGAEPQHGRCVGKLQLLARQCERRLFGLVEQAGIQARSGRSDVNVVGNTDLNGAYIGTTSDRSKNQFATGTPAFSGIENHSDYSAKSFGFGGGFTVGNGGAKERTTVPTSGKSKGGIGPMLPQSDRSKCEQDRRDNGVTPVDQVKLRKYAELLDIEIRANLGRNADVDWLSDYPPLVQAIEDARAGRIVQPRDLGLARWEMESNIQAIRSVSHRLAQFELLLEGLPIVGDED
ncbi:Hemolysin [Pandoraea communis]|uniref:Hemolysin n=2 Tax=Pandoraea communis TaxID=2508297 RepID=A0A5E4YKC4_9BURK|nr:Hemolysin [Pandoraea communis]